jgi:hypothetical protein
MLRGPLLSCIPLQNSCLPLSQGPPVSLNKREADWESLHLWVEKILVLLLSFVLMEAGNLVLKTSSTWREIKGWEDCCSFSGASAFLSQNTGSKVEEEHHVESVHLITASPTLGHLGILSAGTVPQHSVDLAQMGVRGCRGMWKEWELQQGPVAKCSSLKNINLDLLIPTILKQKFIWKLFSWTLSP